MVVNRSPGFSPGAAVNRSSISLRRNTPIDPPLDGSTYYEDLDSRAN